MKHIGIVWLALSIGCVIGLGLLAFLAGGPPRWPPPPPPMRAVAFSDIYELDAWLQGRPDLELVALAAAADGRLQLVYRTRDVCP